MTSRNSFPSFTLSSLTTRIDRQRRLALQSCLIVFLLGTGAPLAAAPAAEAPRFTPEIDEFVRSFKPGGQDFAGQAPSLSAEDAWKRLVPAEGYAVELAASEP